MLTAENTSRVKHIKGLIQKMGQVYQPGNASRPGHLYSPLPFPEFDDVPYQRECVEERFALIRDDLLQFMSSGRLLDVGCHAGFNCFKFDALGFNCTGIEADPLTVEIAQEVAQLRQLDIEFICNRASNELIDSLGQFDAVIFTAVFQWITLAEGFDTAKNFLKNLCRHCDVLYFETSMGQEGKAKMPMLPDRAAVEQMLHEVAHRHVVHVGSLDRDRELFRTSRMTPSEASPVKQVEQVLSDCLKTPPDYEKKNAHFHSRVWKTSLGPGRDVAVKLVRAANENAANCLYREHEFLAALNSPHVPRWLLNGRMGDTYVLVTEWIDGPTLAEPGATELAASNGISLPDQLAEIEAQLLQAGIVHRDIRQKNLIVTGDRLVLIDFGWACRAGEANVFTPAELIQPDDRHAFEAIRNQLLSTAAKTTVVPSCHFNAIEH